MARWQLSRDSLRDAALEGVRWFTVARVAAELAAFACGVVLAHLVPPAAFGQLAVTVIVSELALSLAAESLGSPLVQRESVNRAHFESAALLGLALGVGMTAATFLLAKPVAGPLFGSQAAGLFELLSPIWLLAGLRIVPQATLQRRLDFRRLGAIEIISVLTAAAVSVASAAIFGLDAAAYIVGMLVGAAVAVVLLMAATELTFPRWHRREMREVVGFGAPAGLAGLTWVGFRNIDYAVLGTLMSSRQVGFYYRAHTLGVDSEQRISGIVARVAFPIYSRTDDHEHMRAVRARVVRVNAAAVFPALALFAALAPVLVPWLFGTRWEPAVLPAQILAVGGMAMAINGGTGPLLLAAGRPRVLALFNTIMLVAYAGLVFAMAPLGLTAVCVAVAAFHVAILAAVYAFVLGPIVGVNLRQLARDLTPALTASGALLVVAMPLMALLEGTSVPAIPALALGAALGGSVYLLVLRGLFPAAWADVRLVARHLLPRRAQASVAPARLSGEVPSTAEMTLEEPRVSVVVPARNAAPWVADLLDSVLGQSRPPDEVIVVENESTDGTEEVLERYRDRITLIRMPGRGAAAAYNRGFAAATGDFVAMCPADDVWRPEKLERQMATLAAHPEVDVIFGHARHFGADTSEYARPPGSGILDSDRLRRAMYERNLIAAPTTLIRRSLFERLGGFREDMLVEDYEFWMRALRADATFFYDPHLLVDYRRHGENLSSRLLDMRLHVDHPVHRMYAEDVGRRHSRRVLSIDLRQIGRYHLDAGRLDEALRAYQASLRYRVSAKVLLAVAVLRSPGSNRLCALEQRYRARWTAAET
jgi:PST family polysaccharide transporter